ncbi:MAG TPA: hypothetical protein VNT51_04735 [Miltoncostaeaceae bacterium]|nr:hypothetical protein [Miltoncostaeaceae bacterium]
MLADLERIRDLQVLQRRALIDADGARLDALDAQRAELTARLVPLASSGLQGPALQRARELAQDIGAAQEGLIALAEQLRDRAAAELRDMAGGRTALAGYRVRGGTQAVHLDRSG